MRRALAALTLLSALLSGCTASARSETPDTPSPFAACDALISTASTDELPELSLPCFTGGRQISLRDLPRPAVINVWASWCGPCRDELPVMQGLADRTEGELTVLTVDTGDRREAGASFAADNGVTMPTLYDFDRGFAAAIKAPALPATVFVDPDGAVHVHRDALDVDELIKQVREHTGVTVTR
ncbi:TlpA disulfide reductase family protein [Actinoplanes sp. NPDC023714]|uniref:TlpA family protein disulfide reductase n=1 Tax=Actinoplanes sp. NPDC023714 TaxID=3154322 RepID=UPI0033D63CE6